MSRVEERIREEHMKSQVINLNTCKSQHIANFFIDKSEEDKIGITQLKLIKLVYIAYGWHLATIDKKLFNEPIKTWKNGPVIESLYHEFKHFKQDIINSKSIIFDLDTGDYCIPHVQDKEILDTLDTVWMGYRNFTAESIVYREHKEDTAWYKYYKKDENIIIPDKDIKDDFQRRISSYLEVQKAKYG